MLSDPELETVRRTGSRAKSADSLINDGLTPSDGLRLHWPEYLMEAGEAAIYLFSACAFATLLWHPASPIQSYLPGDVVRRMLMGLAMGVTIMAIVLSPWGKQSGAHFNPAVTFAFWRLGKVTRWDAVFYCTAQLSGAPAGVALAALLLRGAPAHHAVRFAATLPGIHGDGVAFIAELVISFLLMSAIRFATNHRVLAPYTHCFAAVLAAVYIAFESPLSGMSTNPARTFGPAVYGNYWHALWIYFAAPPLGMFVAAQAFLWIREGKGPICAKLHHDNDKRCIFCQSGSRLTATNERQAHYA